VRFLFLCFAAGLVAQETTFRATVPVVLVPVTVTDQRGKLVDGLSEDDFVVTDSGRRVTFRVESPDVSTAPLALMVAVQTNDLSAAALLKIRKIGSMVQPVIESLDRLDIIAFVPKSDVWPVEMEADGIRPTDYAYRDAVDAVFTQIYREGRYGVFSGERHPLVVELVGSRQDRLDQLAQAAAEVSDRDRRGRGC
jgi:hypothetical protein